jgi:CheY-like chemotaxis protein
MDAHDTVASGGAGTPCSARSHHTILVVDDSDVGRYATVRRLEAAGFRTIPADSGVQAVALAEFATAVVLDVQLPYMHGFEVCKAIRQKMPRVPIVHLSAVDVSQPYQSAGRWVGADAYLISPPEPEMLVQILDRLIARQLRVSGALPDN